MKKMISRRDFLKVAGISAAALGLAACGGSSTSTAASTASTAASTGSSAAASGSAVTLKLGSPPTKKTPVQRAQSSLQKKLPKRPAALWKFSCTPPASWAAMLT